MTQEQQRIAIAEACGWSLADPAVVQERNHTGYILCKGPWWHHADEQIVAEFHGLPDYTNDLNAMREAEKILRPLELGSFENILGLLCGGARCDDGGTFVSHREAIHAEASQRAEAFLKTLGKWKEGESE